ncbi:hypothetical protein SLEP1_g17659 [Rubroshorea leprosula]|uniref:Uncharacterized protein n=1 Tax=Rubroshorea leprosula TaxID=152421 RepID=A0AAV5J2J1_9ROSI|nr:hypothetical protein SLEP1_g17659 [Rubroshorea leprosula]
MQFWKWEQSGKHVAGYESEYEKRKKDGIFGFSGSGSSGKTGFRAGRRNLGKKVMKKREMRFRM